jgi:hypothetical protein
MELIPFHLNTMQEDFVSKQDDMCLMALKNDAMGDDIVSIWIHIDTIFKHIDAMLIDMIQKHPFIKESDNARNRIVFC